MPYTYAGVCVCVRVCLCVYIYVYIYIYIYIYIYNTYKYTPKNTKHEHTYVQAAHGMLRASVWYEKFVPDEPHVVHKGGFRVGKIFEAFGEDHHH